MIFGVTLFFALLNKQNWATVIKAAQRYVEIYTPTTILAFFLRIFVKTDRHKKNR
jgi:hypothetical protein